MYNNKVVKIWSYGDSLAQPRQNIVSDTDRYLSQFYSWIRENGSPNCRLYEHSRGNSTVTSLYAWFINDMSYFIDEKKDILIIHCGICDCAPRPIPSKLRAVISRLPNKWRYRCIELIKIIRRRTQRLGIFWRYVKPSEFTRIYREWLETACEEFKRVYVINICPTTDELEVRSPGLKESITLYNQLIYNVIEKVNKENLYLIDINNQIRNLTNDNNNLNEYIIPEDGHHITRETHKIIYNLIKEREKIDEGIVNV